MNYTALATLAALSAAWPGAALSQEPQTRPEWDQKKALETVQRAVDLEKSGKKPWDKIAWVKDADEAARRARQERKPILVYLFKKIKQEWEGPEKWGRC